MEGEWRGVTHTVSTNKSLNSSLPLYTSWKTTTIFLLTQQTSNLGKFEDSFRDRLSKTNVQQNDLYDFDTKSGQILQKRSCFEKVDRAMNTLAHAILNLTHHVVNNVEKFEEIIEELDHGNPHCHHAEQTSKIDTRRYVVSIHRNERKEKTHFKSLNEKIVFLMTLRYERSAQWNSH